jgi:hypothetical protein
VKTISDDAFRECDLQELTILLTVTIIGDEAFADNRNLTRVNLPVTMPNI